MFLASVYEAAYRQDSRIAKDTGLRRWLTVSGEKHPVMSPVLQVVAWGVIMFIVTSALLGYRHIESLVILWGSISVVVAAWAIGYVRWQRENVPREP